jgi:hypothetical protein
VLESNPARQHIQTHHRKTTKTKTKQKTHEKSTAGYTRICILLFSTVVTFTLSILQSVLPTHPPCLEIEHLARCQYRLRVMMVKTHAQLRLHLCTGHLFFMVQAHPHHLNLLFNSLPLLLELVCNMEPARRHQ